MVMLCGGFYPRFSYTFIQSFGHLKIEGSKFVRLKNIILTKDFI